LIFKRRRAVFGMVVLGLSTGFGLLSLVTVLFTNTMRGTDSYGNSVLLSNRLGNTLASLDRNLVTWPALAVLVGLLLVLGTGAWVLYRAGDRERLGRLARAVGTAALVAAGLFAVYLSQLYFYDGTLPTDTRYDLPGALIPAFLGLIGIALVLYTVHLTVRDSFYHALATMLVAFVLAGFVVVTGFSAARAASHDNFERTRQFSAALAQIKAVAQAEPQTPLVFDAHSAWDFEPSYSVVRFLRRDRIENPIYLRFLGNDDLEATIPMQKMFALELDAIARGSLSSPFYDAFSKFTGERCFGIGFSGESTPPCENVVRIWR
jgi:hypothetical protein